MHFVALQASNFVANLTSSVMARAGGLQAETAPQQTDSMAAPQSLSHQVPPSVTPLPRFQKGSIRKPLKRLSCVLGSCHRAVGKGSDPDGEWALLKRQTDALK